MLNSNVNYIQYKIPKPPSIDEEDGCMIDYNNNNSYFNYKKLQYENNKIRSSKQRCFRKKTFNYILKYLLLITFMVLITEVVIYLKYFRKPVASIANRIDQLNFLLVVNNSKAGDKNVSSYLNSHNFETTMSIKEQKNYTLKLLDYKEDLNEHENVLKLQKSTSDFQNVFNSIQNALIQTYKDNNIIIDLCPAVPPSLNGPINFTTLLFNNTNLADLITFYENINPQKQQKPPDNFTLDNTISTVSTETTIKFNSDTDNLNLLNENKVYGNTVKLGGYWKPPDCVTRSKIGVIIPYRDRFVHLAILLRNLHLILQKQLIEYRIFVTEQFGNSTTPFNKGRIMNAAFLEALKIYPKIQCFVFHDVDLILEDDRNMYTCPQHPRHMSVAIDKFGYHLPYSYLIGGVFLLKTEHFKIMNGYSNSYWGWGGKNYF